MFAVGQRYLVHPDADVPDHITGRVGVVVQVDGQHVRLQLPGPGVLPWWIAPQYLGPICPRRKVPT